jgi:hypothetical protein
MPLETSGRSRTLKPRTKVRITCYGETEEMDRGDAILMYFDCMKHSEGCERERYTSILIQLLDGENDCYDE